MYSNTSKMLDTLKLFAYVLIKENENTGDDRVITKNVGGSQPNTDCFFPFLYEGVEYRQCIFQRPPGTTATAPDAFWCGTNYNTDADNYGFCPDGTKLLICYLCLATEYNYP